MTRIISNDEFNRVLAITEVVEREMYYVGKIGGLHGTLVENGFMVEFVTRLEYFNEHGAFWDDLYFVSKFLRKI